MQKLKKRIFENGLEYELVGDYYIPILKLHEESRLVGRYGRLYREYLREPSPVRFNNLVLSGELWTYLADVNELAEERMEVIIRQLKVAEGVTEDAVKQMRTGSRDKFQCGGADCICVLCRSEVHSTDGQTGGGIPGDL